MATPVSTSLKSPRLSHNICLEHFYLPTHLAILQHENEEPKRTLKKGITNYLTCDIVDGGFKAIF